MNDKMKLIQQLYECVRACHHCASECLNEDATMMANCIRTDLDCADICLVTAGLLSRNSKHGKHLLSECIEICTICANECEKHDDDHCKKCAEECRKCIEACKSFQEAA
ncbi:MAG: four-helix bundle copper-binding protein [Flavobacterium sp.]|nr:four-helix bundle copper-binding protein [Flavobacterium sp.]